MQKGLRLKKVDLAFAKKKTPARCKMYLENVNGQKCELVISLNVAVFY